MSLKLELLCNLFKFPTHILAAVFPHPAQLNFAFLQAQFALLMIAQSGNCAVQKGRGPEYGDKGLGWLFGFGLAAKLPGADHRPP